MNESTIMKLIYIILPLFLVISCERQKKDDTARNLLLLSAMTPNDIHVSGVAKASGIVKNAILEVRYPGSAGECSPSAAGSKIQQTTIDSKGQFTLTLPQGVYCLLVIPDKASTVISMAGGLSDEEKEISFSQYSDSIPYLSAIITSSGVLNISPLTRIAAARFQELKRLNGTSYSISNYLSPVTETSTVVNRLTDDASLALQANREIAEMFFANSSAIVDIAANSLDLTDSTISQDEKYYNLIVEGFSYFAGQIASDSDGDSIREPTIQDYEIVWSAFARELSDGMADGVYFNGETIETGKITANHTTLYLGSLSHNFRNYLHLYIQDFSASYTTADVSNLQFCPVPAFNGQCSSAYSCNSSGNDPFFSDQWHLQNTGQSGGTSGEDANVSSVWTAGNMADGIIIGLVDDGADIFHEDLKENFIGGGFNFKTTTTRAKNDPSAISASHGTSVAGVMSARGWNDKGLRGIAPCAHLVAFNLLQNYTTSNEILAMSGNKAIAVSNNSWGATDGLGTLAPANSTWKDAVDDGLANGRGQKGTVYVWASGNGGYTNWEIDNSNYDGQANYYGVIAVGAIGNDGKMASYSDKGANVLVVAHSQGYNGGSTNAAISTTDLTGNYGFNSSGSGDYDNIAYTKNFNGTSSSAPVVAGAVALLLKQNASLTWRDVRLILAASARKNDATDSDWSTNSAGYPINHKYGFGALDSQKAVQLAGNWSSVGGSVNLRVYPSTITFSETTANLTIPDNSSTGVSSAITINGSSIGKIEFVEVKVNISHTYPGDLKIVLKNSVNTHSDLALKHTCYSETTGSTAVCGQYNNWVFGSVRHIDEAADSTWTLTVSDLESKDTGTLKSWGIKFYGR